MQLIVWNSQGAKWDTLFSAFFEPIAFARENILALVVESGWAPWVKSGDVKLGGYYPMNVDMEYYEPSAEAKSALCARVKNVRRCLAYWVPWVKNLDAMKTNTRCSLGAIQYIPTYGHRFYTFDCEGALLRPVVRIFLFKGDTAVLTILVVHLKSGNPSAAQEEINTLVSAIPKWTEGLPAIIVGDFNINLKTHTPALPDGGKWAIVKTGAAAGTQKSGGELDYAIIYDPNKNKLIGDTTAAVLAKYKTPPNGSDHSVMGYSLTNF